MAIGLPQNGNVFSFLRYLEKYFKYRNTSLSLNLARKYARILLLLSAPRGEQFSICGLRGTDKANIFHDVRDLTTGEYHWVSLVLAGAY